MLTIRLDQQAIKAHKYHKNIFYLNTCNQIIPRRSKVTIMTRNPLTFDAFILIGGI
jgi:hypothetical protein